MGDVLHNVAERGKIIVTSGTVHAVIDGDKANATLTQDFHNLTDFQIVTTHAAHVLDTQVLHIPGFHFFHHCQESGTVKASTTNAIVCVVVQIDKPMLFCIGFKHLLLMNNAIAVTVSVIIARKPLI